MQFMQWLIDRGADIKARSLFDTSTLSKAIVDGSMEVVRFLLAKEKDVNRGDLLHCAAERGARIDAHRYLNDEALKYRYQSKLGTPLHTALYNANLPVAKALLDHGANLNCKMLLKFEKTGPTPLDLAIKTGDQRWIDLFMASSLLETRV
jgi:ankyrin repeat protein